MINLSIFEKNLNVFYNNFAANFIEAPRLEEVREMLIKGEFEIDGCSLMDTRDGVHYTVSYDPYLALLTSVVIKDVEKIREYTACKSDKCA